MSPGPSVALVIRTAVSHGRTSALAVAFAHGIGIALYAAAVVLGLAALIQSSTFLMTSLQVCGALFLIYLGFRMLSGGIETFNKGTDDTLGGASGSEARGLSHWQHALSGFLIVFFNPKVVIFFLAIFSQFLNADQSLMTQLVAASMAGGIDAAWYALVAVCVSNRRFLSTVRAASPMIDGVFGLLFMAFGAVVILRLV